MLPNGSIGHAEALSSSARLLQQGFGDGIRAVNGRAFAKPQNVLAGIGLAIASVACFAALDTTTKFVTLGVPLLMAVWFRYAFQAVATTLVVLPLRGCAVRSTLKPRSGSTTSVVAIA